MGGAKSAALSIKNSMQKYYANPSVCLQCKNVIEVKAHEKIIRVRYRKFCSSSCSATFNNLKKPKKSYGQCPRCPSPITSKGCGYCSRSCSALSRSEAAFAVGKSSHQSARLTLIRNRGAKCGKCGWADINQFSGRCPIVMNHIDGDSTNMAESNLELLCPNCDSLTPTYKALNRGRGRTKRLDRFRSGKSY